MSDSEEVFGQIGNNTYIRGGKYGPEWTIKPKSTPPAPPTNPGTPLPPDPAALHARINTLQAELNTTNSVNANLAASVTRLQTELENMSTVITQLVTSGLQPEQATPTPTTTATTTPTPTMPSTPTTTTAPLPFPHPHQPLTTPCGRGAASPEVFQEIIKTNWHGRLGRAHMVDVDALPASALMELDCLLRRKLYDSLPHEGNYSAPQPDIIFASLAALGLRLEDRGDYADQPDESDSLLRKGSTVRRGRVWTAGYLRPHTDYWRAFALETLIELARYRGLFDNEGLLRKDS